MPKKFDWIGHLCLLTTLLLTVYGQLVLKWQIDKAGAAPELAIPKIIFVLRQLMNPWILSGLAAAFLASLVWMIAMTRMDLGYGYPFMSLAFVIVMIFGVLFLGEAFTLQKGAGTALVMAGLVLIARA